MMELLQTIFQNTLRDCMQKLGLDPSIFSTHPFRRGFATLAFQCEIPPEYIQLLGDWKSDAYKCYLEFSWKDMVKILQSMLHGIIFRFSSQDFIRLHTKHVSGINHARIHPFP